MWGSSNRSVIDSGHNNTGFTIPKTPGSNAAFDAAKTTDLLKSKSGTRRRSAAATRPWSRGNAHRAASAIDRQSAHHRQRTAAKPPNQMLKGAAGTHPEVSFPAAGSADASGSSGPEKAWLMVSMTSVRWDCMTGAVIGQFT